MGRRRGAGAAVREDLVDHRGLGDARDDPHGPATGRAGQRVNFEELRQERRRSAGTMAGGPAAAASALFSHMPRERLAYQPSYRVVTGRGISIGLGRVSGERTARSPTARGPAGAPRPARRPPPRLGGRPDVVSRGRPVAAGTDRTPPWDGRAHRTSPHVGGASG